MSRAARVVVTRRLPRSVEERLAAVVDARLNADDRALAPDQLTEALRTADGLLATVTDRLTADVLPATPRRAGIVANFGAGVDHIDLDAAREAGIVVTNTPGVLTDATADLTIALLLAVARRIGEGERLVRSGAWTGWAPTQMLGSSVTGSTLGIVGMGRIGRAVARRASRGFGMRVLYHQPRPADEAELAGLDVHRAADLDELLAESDAVTLHCPATPETRHLMDARRLARMRPGAFLINTSRGEVVDEAALADALASGTIAGAGLDVYEHEPQVPEALLRLENVVLLPHLGSATLEARTAMGHLAVDNLAAFLRGEPPPNRVA
jgi:lactate dehydrogenase-like 2-hydroxyacid dehydrogenase